MTVAILLLAVALRVAPHLDRSERPAAAPGSIGGENVLLSGEDLHPGGERSVERRAAALAIEALLIGVVLYRVLRSRTVGANFPALPVRYRIASAALVCAIVVGLVAGTNPNIFPFVTWRMYADEMRMEQLRVARFIGTFRSGRSERLDVDRLLPALRPQRLYSLLAHQVSGIRAQKDRGARGAELFSKHEETLKAVGRIYNRRHPDDPLARISVWIGTVARGDRPDVFYREVWAIDVN
ncbi:MAG TPA: hypothetical protein VGH16_00660 [Candidatus Binatia bacterium]